jgi:hypothetical protein
MVQCSAVQWERKGLLGWSHGQVVVSLTNYTSKPPTTSAPCLPAYLPECV